MFNTTLDLREYAPDEWVVLNELVWERGGFRVSVPRGFITDLASIPRFLRGVLDVNGASRAPAVLHDYLYCAQPVSRAFADNLLRTALAVRGVAAVERNAFYAGVRLFGWLYWRRRKAGLQDDDFVPSSYWGLVEAISQ